MIKKYKKHLIELFSIAAPLLIGNIGHALTSVADVFVAAKYSVDTLAAVSISNALLFTVFIVGIGFLTGISIILSNIRGEKKRTKKYLLSSILLSQFLALITWLVIILINFLIPYFGFDEKLIPDIQNYIYITSFSIFGMFLYQGIKEFLQAHEIVNFANYVLIVTVFINLILNFIFVFGYGFIPAMGTEGLALATLIVRTLLGFSLVFYTRKIIVEQYSQKKYDCKYMLKILKIGLPIGVGLLLECLSFNIITFFVGRESGLYAATHNILITIVDTTFMIPLAISSAIAIKVGYYNGAGDLDEIKNYSKIGVFTCFVFMLVCSLLFISNPKFFINIFTNNEQILSIAIPIVALFALSELADGVQIALGGILKGLKMTKQVLICVLSSYWLVGLPVGFYLAYQKQMYLKGFWIGLTVALFLIAITEFCIIIKTLYNYKREGFA